MTPTLTHVADFLVEVGQPITVGETAQGLRRVVPITGGTIRGARLEGTILNAGADFQIIGPDGFTRLEARYVVRLADGAMLYVENCGVRFGPPELMARIARGEPVDPTQVYFRSTPRFETAATRLSMADSALVHRLRRPASGPGRPFGIRGWLARRPDRVGHHSAALAKRLFGTHRRIVRGLMLDLRVELAAEQNHDG